MIVRVENLWSGRGAEFGADGERSYTAQVRVVTDSILDGQMAVLFAPGVPRVGLGWYIASDGTPDYQAVCTRASPRQEDGSGLIWIVDCEFSTRGLTRDPGGFGGTGDTGGYNPGQGGAADDPTLEPPEIDFDYETTSSPMRRQLKGFDTDTPTWDGEPCTNSAGDYFDPLPEVENGWPVLIYTRTQAEFDIPTARKYAFAINKDTWLGVQPYHAQCLPMRGRRIYKGGLKLWRVTMRIRFLLSTGPQATWNPTVAQLGFRELVGGVKRDILDQQTQQPITVPKFLNADGTVRSEALLLSDGPIYKELKAYKAVNFAPLNIVI